MGRERGWASTDAVARPRYHRRPTEQPATGWCICMRFSHGRAAWAAPVRTLLALGAFPLQLSALLSAASSCSPLGL
eukprot:11328584-Alexandrium_andersonii.AAC.1